MMLLRSIGLFALAASASGQQNGTLDDALTELTPNVTYTPSPNEVFTKPDCNTTSVVVVRYSATTGRLYVEVNSTVTPTPEEERGGCLTLDQIWEARGGGSKEGAKAPLYAVDPVTGEYSSNITGTWLLEEDLYVLDGVTLKVRTGT